MPRQPHSCEEVISKLEGFADPLRLAGLARYGIETSSAFGVSMPEIKSVANGVTQDRDLAHAVWNTGIHEARILSAFLYPPKELTEEDMQSWVVGFNSWDLCDQVCGVLFDKCPDALSIADQWTLRDEEFVKRAGFVVYAWHAVHHKKTPDTLYHPAFDHIERECADPRNFVKKAVNWCLRQLGKRSADLHAPALDLANHLCEHESKVARWIGNDARRELQSDKIRARLGL
ncbi:MAG: DNA alkylation repair protein [Pseudomonadota bacterium]